MSGQSFHVIRCAQCKTYQVHIVKKSSNKWNCKVCSTKQSIQQVFGKGSSGECRVLVQRFNEVRGAIEDQKRAEIVNQLNQETLAKEFEDFRDKNPELTYNSNGSESSNYHYDEYSSTASCDKSSASHSQTESFPGNPSKYSKWSKFLDDEDGNHLY